MSSATEIKNVHVVPPPTKCGPGTYFCACCRLHKIAKALEYCAPCETERIDPNSRFTRIGHCCA